MQGFVGLGWYVWLDLRGCAWEGTVGEEADARGEGKEEDECDCG